MKKFITCIVISASLVLTSCATIFPVHNPNINRDEFAGLVAAESDRTACYTRGFRGFTLLLDFVFGAPFLFVPLIWDGVSGKYTVYYYNHKRCEKMKAEKRNAKPSNKISTVYGEADPAFRPQQPPQQKIPQRVEPVRVNNTSSYQAPMPAPASVYQAPPQPTVEQNSTPATEVEDSDEYELLY